LVLTSLLAALFLLLAGSANAGPDATPDALDRLEEVLELRVDDGRLKIEDVVPAILVSAQPRYEANQEWFSTGAIEVLQRTLGTGSLRLCEACMAPRAYIEDGQLVYQTGPVGLDEVVRLDDRSRGESQPARTAIWLNEYRGGVTIRIIDLNTGGVVLAQNVDPNLVEVKNTQRTYSLAAELERRARGDSLTQAFVDVAIYPGQHLSMDWTDQWGKTNANMSGLTISLFDPIAGIGACHYRRIEVGNVLVGAKGIVSLPTALVRAVGDNGFDAIDPLLTGVGVIRVPFGRSNYGAIGTISTNGEVGIGISLMNISLLPVLL
jgi:hypothetical protein